MDGIVPPPPPQHFLPTSPGHTRGSSHELRGTRGSKFPIISYNSNTDLNNGKKGKNEASVVNVAPGHCWHCGCCSLKCHISTSGLRRHKNGRVEREEEDDALSDGGTNWRRRRRGGGGGGGGGVGAGIPHGFTVHTQRNKRTEKLGRLHPITLLRG